MTAAHTEATVLALLERRYPPPEYAFFRHAASGTGRHKERTADAIAMNLYPSRGLEVHGFEVKVSAGDLRRELKEPDKAESFVRWCDRWWIVAPADALPLALAGIPPTWGVLEVRKSTIRMVRDAPKLAPEALDRPFIAALARNMAKHKPGEAEIKAQVAVRVAELETELGARTHKAVTDLEEELKYERAAFAKLWRALGLDATEGRRADAVQAWRVEDLADELGGARKLVHELRSGRFNLGTLERLVNEDAERGQALLKARVALLAELARLTDPAPPTPPNLLSPEGLAS